ncbi:MAG TPA: glycoside hydrolase family 3 C-terminal domain-containing protein [Bryobacteraceae bacterium]
MTPPYKNANLPAEQRAEDLLARMTLEEKVAMLAGATWMESAPNARLGIPSLKMADGPVGVRSWAGPSALTNAPRSKLPQAFSTAFPAGVALGATWDPEMARRVGQALGQEVRALGRNMLLGPSINIHRTPWAGRNFETYGEDPYLTSRLVVGYIQGMQSEGVIATVKHFAANSQEFERRTIDEKIGERALHEIYFPAFKAAVEEAGVWSVMSAYNKVNGFWCSENAYLLTETLKRRWGFKGFVVSDWGGTHSTVDGAVAGLDIEMPGPESVRLLLNHDETTRHRFTGGFQAAELVLPAIESGKIPQAAVDDRVRRMLRAMFSVGIFDRNEAATGDVDTTAEIAVARAAATEGIVLLKNERGVLPLEGPKVRSIAVIGPSAVVARTGGGGSSNVRPKYAISPLEGIRARAGDRFQVGYALGAAMEGEDQDKDSATLLKEAAALAAKSDVAVVFVGNSSKLEAESFDRKTLGLPAGQDDLIQAVAAANPRTVVVLIAGSPVLMDGWIARIPALLAAWYPGQEGGHAIADILFGDANPSGKLPMTFLKEWKDSPAYGHYPGENGVVEYAEGIYVGYRHFDKHNIEPLFPFGHGLSYTTFTYSDLKVSRHEVSLAVRNTGSREGAEVVQLYVGDRHSSVDRPVKELKGFRRVVLKPGESKTVRFSLDKSAISYYSTARHEWVAEPGTFEVLVGASSRDIRLSGKFALAGE